MSQFVLATDSSCDLPHSFIADNNILFIPFYVSFDGLTYKKEISELSLEQFYKTMRSSVVYPKSSLPTISDYIDAFAPVLKSGKDILCFCLSQKFSGSYQSAVNAANILQEEYAERKIIVVDSSCATQTQGAILFKAAQFKAMGLTLDAVNEKIKPIIDNSKIYFTVGSLEYLQRGGRVGKASALAGTILNIKPVLSLYSGELHPEAKIRGRKKSLSELARLTLEETKGNIAAFEFGIVHADCIEEANQLIDLLKTEYNIITTLPLSMIGVTIGAHTGPDTIGVSIIPKL